jgi:hypothetical protein
MTFRNQNEEFIWRAVFVAIASAFPVAVKDGRASADADLAVQQYRTRCAHNNNTKVVN